MSQWDKKDSAVNGLWNKIGLLTRFRSLKFICGPRTFLKPLKTKDKETKRKKQIMQCQALRLLLQWEIKFAALKVPRQCPLILLVKKGKNNSQCRERRKVRWWKVDFWDTHQWREKLRIWGETVCGEQ